MMYIHSDIKRVNYDLSSIQIGESIFSSDSGEYYLCIKEEDSWLIFSYKNDSITKHNVENPSIYIFSNNEVFDVKKTEWVKKYWMDTDIHFRSIDNFKLCIKKGFL